MSSSFRKSRLTSFLKPPDCSSITHRDDSWRETEGRGGEGGRKKKKGGSEREGDKRKEGLKWNEAKERKVGMKEGEREVR